MFMWEEMKRRQKQGIAQAVSAHRWRAAAPGFGTPTAWTPFNKVTIERGEAASIRKHVLGRDMQLASRFWESVKAVYLGRLKAVARRFQG